MPNRELTLEYVRKRTRRFLGSSGVTVELSDDDVDECLSDAVRLYNQARPRRGRDVLPTSTSQKKYGPIDPVLNSVSYKNNLIGVTQVTALNILLPVNGVDPFSGISPVVNGGFAFAGGNNFADIEQQLGALETGKSVLSVEFEWHGQFEGVDYYLYIDRPSPSQRVGYEYVWGVDATDDANFGLKMIDAADVQWTLAYTLAKSKTILTRLRGKYHGVTSADGGTMENDYSDLASEAATEIEKLEASLNDNRRPLAPIFG